MDNGSDIRESLNKRCSNAQIPKFYFCTDTDNPFSASVNIYYVGPSNPILLRPGTNLILNTAQWAERGGQADIRLSE